MWLPLCGGFLSQEKLLMAARLMVGDNKAGRIFRGLLKDDHGLFEGDVTTVLSSRSLKNRWEQLSKDNILSFKRKVKGFC